MQELNPNMTTCEYLADLMRPYVYYLFMAQSFITCKILSLEFTNRSPLNSALNFNLSKGYIGIVNCH